MSETMDEFEAFRQKKLAEKEKKQREEALTRQADAAAPDDPLAFVPDEERGAAPPLAGGYQSHRARRGTVEAGPPPAGLERIEKAQPAEALPAPEGFESHRYRREKDAEEEYEKPAGFDSGRHDR